MKLCLLLSGRNWLTVWVTLRGINHGSQLSEKSECFCPPPSLWLLLTLSPSSFLLPLHHQYTLISLRSPLFQNTNTPKLERKFVYTLCLWSTSLMSSTNNQKTGQLLGLQVQWNLRIVPVLGNRLWSRGDNGLFSFMIQYTFCIL